MRCILLVLIMAVSIGTLKSQSTVTGNIFDAQLKDALIGAAVVLEGTTTGVTTDIDGNFTLNTSQDFPFRIQISYISYRTTTIDVTAANSKNLRIGLKTDAVIMKAVEVKAQRISQKQQQAALTVESMDVLAIKEASSGSFYESLGNLKEVDVTSASLGFKVINTRGFNSTSPVRSLQLIDGVDNQSPGLNFSLGNFLGASDLDVKNVEIIAGASSAFFGPGAFNGVVNMTTKDPFDFPGVSVEVKVGERAMFQRVVRLGDFIKDKEGKKRFGYELNWFTMEANDWKAENYDPIEGGTYGADHPFGYDAVNIYGDEPVGTNNDNTEELFQRPGLSVFFRNGYRERDLLSYDTKNQKMAGTMAYRFGKDITASYGLNYSTGSTIYQGDNRYALKDVQFYQNRLEIGEKDKWFIRGYRTAEDAGKTYDVVTTAIRMQEAQGTTLTWNMRYKTLWSNTFDMFPELTEEIDAYKDMLIDSISNGHITGAEGIAIYNTWMIDWIDVNSNILGDIHEQHVDLINSQSGGQLEAFYEPGTARFDSLFQVITTKNFTEGGSRFYDKSALNHLQGEYKTEWKNIEWTMGGGSRWYRPDSRGTIFNDTLGYTYQRDSVGNIVLDGQGRKVATDSSRVVVKNQEYGVFLGATKKFAENKFTASATIRMDKNENFDFIYSPAASLVYTPDETTTYRMSISSAVRNPTLADQYLYYNVGRAILLGNISGRFEEGRDSLFTIESFSDYRDTGRRDTIRYFHVESIRPEKVRTMELGYRGKVNEDLFVDLGGYYSRYTDFIGYEIGLSAEFDPILITSPPRRLIAYRVASNAKSIVTTVGGSIGFSYYHKKTAFTGNYSYNELISGEDDPIIPAFNTPKHKFNLGISARELMLFNSIPHFGFGVNYKWIQGFLFEGSPQFTGSIPTYDMLDAQVNVYIPSVKTTIKLGGSNIIGIRPLFAKGVDDRWQAARNNNNYQVYGGPKVGRLLYVSLLLELK